MLEEVVEVQIAVLLSVPGVLEVVEMEEIHLVGREAPEQMD